MSKKGDDKLRVKYRFHWKIDGSESETGKENTTNKCMMEGRTKDM